MQVLFYGSSTLVLDCQESDIIGQIKLNEDAPPKINKHFQSWFQLAEEIAALERLKALEIELYASGSSVADGVSAWSFKSTPIDLTIGLRGAALARAGKVRGQTPKVEKQEKKKKKTGRAKKRMQYNKRFVNVGASSGHNHGPNSTCAPSTLT